MAEQTPINRTERHFRVVRFFNDFIAGEVEQIIASDLTLEEAEQLFNREKGTVADEDVVIQDQNIKGAATEVEAFDSPRDRNCQHRV
jgi:hypothetical protein